MVSNGAKRVSSLPEALQICEHFEDLWVIGGAQLYAQALPLACHAVVTEIGLPFDGDVFAPPFPPAWQERSRQPHIAANGLPFAFVSYVNTGLADGAA
ncbi:MAG: dihydrofolate reductase [Betaproteobacteria bacterium]|nr:dihydrofolate reductase [Betaproteobacteria bacterium]